jgi:hypothetical protein
MKIRYSDLHKSVHQDHTLTGPLSQRPRSRRTSWDEALARFGQAEKGRTVQTQKQDAPKRGSNTQGS